MNSRAQNQARAKRVGDSPSSVFGQDRTSGFEWVGSIPHSTSAANPIPALVGDSPNDEPIPASCEFTRAGHRKHSPPVGKEASGARDGPRAIQRVAPLPDGSVSSTPHRQNPVSPVEPEPLHPRHAGSKRPVKTSNPRCSSNRPAPLPVAARHCLHPKTARAPREPAPLMRGRIKDQALR